MANEYSNLPGDCFTTEITHNPGGIIINAELLTSYDFPTGQTANLIITKGRIVITIEPIQSNIIQAINELQLRQDELDENFTPAILALVGLLK